MTEILYGTEFLVATPGGVFATASAGGLLLHDGAKWFERGGTYD